MSIFFGKNQGWSNFSDIIDKSNLWTKIGLQAQFARVRIIFVRKKCRSSAPPLLPRKLHFFPQFLGKCKEIATNGLQKMKMEEPNLVLFLLFQSSATDMIMSPKKISMSYERSSKDLQSHIPKENINSQTLDLIFPAHVCFRQRRE